MDMNKNMEKGYPKFITNFLQLSAAAQAAIKG